MPRERGISRCLPRIYKWSFENQSLFWCIQAQKQIIPTLTIDQGIVNYVKLMGYKDDEWDLDVLRTTYSRLLKEFYDDSKNGN